MGVRLICPQPDLRRFAAAPDTDIGAKEPSDGGGSFSAAIQKQILSIFGRLSFIQTGPVVRSRVGFGFVGAANDQTMGHGIPRSFLSCSIPWCCMYAPAKEHSRATTPQMVSFCSQIPDKVPSYEKPQIFVQLTSKSVKN
jgi:hypothetical protein